MKQGYAKISALVPWLSYIVSHLEAESGTHENVRAYESFLLTYNTLQYILWSMVQDSSNIIGKNETGHLWSRYSCIYYTKISSLHPGHLNHSNKHANDNLKVSRIRKCVANSNKIACVVRHGLNCSRLISEDFVNWGTPFYIIPCIPMQVLHTKLKLFLCPFILH